jgi:hypothetical protein
VVKQQRVDICTELLQLASDDETFLFRVITFGTLLLLPISKNEIEAERTPV